MSKINIILCQQITVLSNNNGEIYTNELLSLEN